MFPIWTVIGVRNVLIPDRKEIRSKQMERFRATDGAFAFIGRESQRC